MIQTLLQVENMYFLHLVYIYIYIYIYRYDSNFIPSRKCVFLTFSKFL